MSLVHYSLLCSSDPFHICQSRYVPWMNLSLSMFRETHHSGANHYAETLEAMQSPKYLYTGYWMTSTVGRDGTTCELAPSLFQKTKGDVSCQPTSIACFKFTAITSIYLRFPGLDQTPWLCHVCCQSRHRAAKVTCQSF